MRNRGITQRSKRYLHPLLSALAISMVLSACKYPLEIVGNGDIVDLNGTGLGCTLEQFNADDITCSENDVTGDYIVNFQAKPRPGWRFVRWEGPCSDKSVAPNCRFDVLAIQNEFIVGLFPAIAAPATVAIFEPATAANSQYSYDAAGRLLGVTYGDGSAINYSYDNSGNILARDVVAAAEDN